MFHLQTRRPAWWSAAVLFAAISTCAKATHDDEQDTFSDPVNRLYMLIGGIVLLCCLVGCCCLKHRRGKNQTSTAKPGNTQAKAVVAHEHPPSQASGAVGASVAVSPYHVVDIGPRTANEARPRSDSTTSLGDEDELVGLRSLEDVDDASQLTAKPMYRWTVGDVVVFLESLDFDAQITREFAEQHVDGLLLLNLTAGHLTSLGVSSALTQLRLMLEIKDAYQVQKRNKMRQQPSAGPAAAGAAAASAAATENEGDEAHKLDGHIENAEGFFSAAKKWFKRFDKLSDLAGDLSIEMPEVPELPTEE